MVARIVLWSLLVLALSADCATMCEQFFTIQGKTYGTMSMLVYQEKLTGECESYRLHYVFIHDSLTTSMEVGGFDKPTDGFFQVFGRETCDSLRDSSGVICIGYNQTCTAPAEDSCFDRKWVEFIMAGGSSSRDWCELYPMECAEYPSFSGVEADLIYEHAGSLYRGYSIELAEYYPRSGILALITHQPRTAVGHDTMHGVLVYRLSPLAASAGSQSGTVKAE